MTETVDLREVLGSGPLRIARGLIRTVEPDGASIADGDRDALEVVAALVVWAQQHGHVCMDIDRIAQILAEAGAIPTFDGVAIRPERDVLKRALDAHPWFVRRCNERPSADDALAIDTPLIVHRWFVYSQRQFADECTVVERIRSFAGAVAPLAGTVEADLADRQRLAVETALSRRLTIITGGPGTGKTYTVARLVTALRSAASAKPPTIAVAAPTGKAAQRVADALDGVEATTIHRLLGPTGSSTRFLADAHDPLPHDVVIVDEVSMVSLQLMARLLDALRPDARLILVGDTDQLESVESGSVLQDLVTAARAPGSPLEPCVCELDHGFRAVDEIAAVAEQIRSVPKTLTEAASATERLIAFLEQADGLAWIETDDPLASFQPAADEIVSAARKAAAAARAGDGEGALAVVEQQRVLCAHREGPWGVRRWNELVRRSVSSGFDEFAPGAPLLVTSNDPATGLVNGATGVVALDGDHTTVVFDGGQTRVDPYHLPATELAYAMTIHKSQGSEYERVVVVLPPATSPILNRELVYTAVTRAKRFLTIVGSREALTATLLHGSIRASGLRRALSG